MFRVTPSESLYSSAEADPWVAPTASHVRPFQGRWIEQRSDAPLTREAPKTPYLYMLFTPALCRQLASYPALFGPISCFMSHLS